MIHFMRCTSIISGHKRKLKTPYLTNSVSLIQSFVGFSLNYTLRNGDEDVFPLKLLHLRANIY